MPRLFIALWPDDDVRAALARVQDACRPPGARPVAPADLHLTLAFLGPVDAAIRACAAAACAAAAAPVDITLDVTGGFGRARVAWVAPASVPAALAALHATLWQGLAADCGCVPEAGPFRPHVTLWRDVARPPAPARCAPIRWRANALYIVESPVDRGAAHYRPVEVFRGRPGAE